MFKNIKNRLALYSGKITLFALKITKKSGTALPGYIALKINKSFLENISTRCGKIILITGTNGKTTTNNLINHVFSNFSVLSNLRGANMIQGVASTYIHNTKDYYDYGIFEVDEGSLDHVSRYLKPEYIILTNFFRDQLDRYGEIEGIIREVLDDISLLPDTKLIINCDDPFVNQFSRKLPNHVIEFGMNIDSTGIIEENLIMNKCPLCGGKLNYAKYIYGHLGDYYCSDCGFNNDEKDYQIVEVNAYNSSQEIVIKHDKNTYRINFPYTGLYNAYNVCATFALANEIGLELDECVNSMETFEFSLGRMEEFAYKDKKVKVVLTKNPVGLGEVTRTISGDERRKSIVHILNDNPADGRDISWIWDANTVVNNEERVLNYYCSGIRAEDIALKKKYDLVDVNKIVINDNMHKCIDVALEDDVEILYVLPTYTAIFETRDYISSKVNGREN